MKIDRVVLGTVFALTLAAPAAWAQAPVLGPEAREDLREIREDRQKLRADRAAGNAAAVEADKQELRRDPARAAPRPPRIPARSAARPLIAPPPASSPARTGRRRRWSSRNRIAHQTLVLRVPEVPLHARPF